MSERQVGKTLTAIRPDHVGRYEWATKWARGRVLDVACGCGYGAHILAKSGCRVDAIDNSEEAIAYAKEHWAHDRIHFCRVNALCWYSTSYDWAVCFETLEHIPNDEIFLHHLRARASNLLVSVPNEVVEPFSSAKFPFHSRHYTLRELDNLLRSTGWGVLEMWTQATKKTRKPQRGANGRTLIARCVGS